MSHEHDPLSEKAWWSRVDACRLVKRDKLPTWQDSVAYRVGRPFRTAPSEDTVNIPADWSRTKNKQSQLFYQCPEVILQALRPEWVSVSSLFAAALNHELSEVIHAEHMMNECLSDVINATGLMACMVSYEASFDDVKLPTKLPDSSVEGEVMGETPQEASQLPLRQEGTSGSPSPDVIDPSLAGAQGGAQGALAPQQGGVPVVQGEVIDESLVARPVYECYKAERLSTAHLIWPVEFVGSDFQRANYLGREGYLPLAEAQRRGWVDDRAEGVQIVDQDWFLTPEFCELKPTDKFIKYVEVFYRPYAFDRKEKDPRKIKRVVLIEGGGTESRKKVIDEDFKWQKYSPTSRKWVGMTKFPIKVGKLTHISDMAIPPSDSEMGRAQVRELIKSRTQMIRQRDHSMPLRWFDVNQVDPVIGEKLRRGKWQDMIPMNGPGDHAIGEVARASYPSENWNFDKTIKADLDESWSMSNMQQGISAPGETTATEVKEISGASNVRLDFEKQWALRFFLEVAEGVGQLMQLFQDEEAYAWVIGEDGAKQLQAWNKDVIPGEYVFKARPDSQLRLDVSQRRTEGLNLFKLLRKDPLIDPAVLIRRVLEDHGIDPAKAMAKPKEPQPEKAKISATFKGEDLINPMAVALVNKSSTPVTAEDIAAAKKLIEQMNIPTQPPQPPVGDPNAPPASKPNSAHGGTPPVVEALGRRYEQGGDHGQEGSRDTAFPQ